MKPCGKRHLLDACQIFTLHSLPRLACIGVKYIQTIYDYFSAVPEATRPRTKESIHMVLSLFTVHRISLCNFIGKFACSSNSQVVNNFATPEQVYYWRNWWLKCIVFVPQTDKLKVEGCLIVHLPHEVKNCPQPITLLVFLLCCLPSSPPPNEYFDTVVFPLISAAD